jgi:hypothetical protein
MGFRLLLPPQVGFDVSVIGVYTPYSRKDICYNILARCIGGVDCENAIAD